MSEILPKGTIVFYKIHNFGYEFDYPKFLQSAKNKFLDYKMVPHSYTGDLHDYYYDDPLLDEDWAYRKMPARIEQFIVYGPNAFLGTNKDSNMKMVILDVHNFKFDGGLQTLHFYECMYLDPKNSKSNNPKFFVRSQWVLPITEEYSSNLDYIKNKIVDRIKKKRNI